MKIALVAFDPRVKFFWGQNASRVKVSGVKVSFEELGVKVSGGQSAFGVKVSWGQSVSGVKVSLGSKCRWGQSVFGVKMGVSLLFTIREITDMFVGNQNLWLLNGDSS